MAKQMPTSRPGVRISSPIDVLYKSLISRRAGNVYVWSLDEGSDESEVLAVSDIIHVATCDSQIAITTAKHIIEWRAGNEPNALQRPGTEATCFYHGALFAVTSSEESSRQVVTIVECYDRPRNNAVQYTLPLRSDSIEIEVRRIDESGTNFSVGWLRCDDHCELLLYNAAARQFSRRNFHSQQDWISELLRVSFISGTFHYIHVRNIYPPKNR